MKIIQLLLLIALLIALTGDAQITFHKTISSGHMSNVIVTNDGNYLTAITNNGISGIELVKFNSTGDSIWTKTFTDPSDQPIVRQIIQTSDNGYALCGFVQGNFFLFLMKTDEDGNLSFFKQFDDTLVGTYQNVSIAENTAGNLVLTGGGTNPFTFDDGFIIVTDNSGYILWSNKYGTSDDYEDVNRLIITHDDFFLLAGSDASRVMLSKTNEQGNIVWWKNYTPVFGNGYDVSETLDDGYIIAGNSGNSIIAMKTDSSGQVTWCKGYRKNSVALQIVSLIPTSDSGFVFLSTAGTPVNDIFLLKINSDGDTMWTHAYGTDSTTEEAHYGYYYSASILETNSGELIFSGEEKLPLNQFASAIYRVNSTGDICEGFRPAGLDSVYSISMIASNPAITSWDNFYDVLPSDLFATSVTYNPSLTNFCLATTIENTDPADVNVFVFPNPTSKIIVVDVPAVKNCSFLLNNSLGEEIMKYDLTPGRNNIQIRVASGIYFYILSDRAGIFRTGKIIVTK